MIQQKDFKTEPIPPYGEHMSIKEFIEHCDCGGFINSDGFGHYSTKTEMTDLIVQPLDIIEDNIDHRFSHVVWFNK